MEVEMDSEAPRADDNTTISSVSSPLIAARSTHDSPQAQRPNIEEKDQKIDEKGHRVVLTVTAVIACSKGADEQAKLLEELVRKNKRTLESPKPQQFFHCEYGIAPGQERTAVDIVSYGIAAKVFTENDSRVIKTWDDGTRIWVAWVNSHELFITEDNIMDLYGHTLQFKLWDSKDKVSAKARFDRPKAFRIPSTKDASPGKGVANIVAKQSRSWTNLQPKDSAMTISQNEAKTIDEPEELHPAQENRVPSARVRSSIRRLAKLDLADHEKKRINDLKIQKSKLMTQLGKKTATQYGDHDKPSDSSQVKETKKNSAETTSIRTVNVPIKLELLFSGLKEVTSRLETPSVNVEDMLVSVSVGGRLMPEDLERKLNPLVITIKSLKDLPNTPVPRNRLSELCQPVYCCYKFLDEQVHKTQNRSHDKNVHFEDMHVVLAGKLDSGKLFEFLHSDGLSIEVHDRDRKLPDVVKSPTVFGDDDDDKKIANVGLVSSKYTTHNAFHDRHRIYDPYGTTKIRLNELLHGNATLTFMAAVNPCPLPELLLNPNSAEPGIRLVGVVGSIDRPENPPLPTGDYLSSGTMLKVKVSLKYPLAWKSTPGAEAEIDEESCPFSRIIYHFNYENKKLLQTLEKFVTEANIVALGFDQFDRKVAEAALSTYKLSEEQKSSATLDVITGFHVIDGEFHLFVLEGLKTSAMLNLKNDIGNAPCDAGGFVRMLCDTSVSFKSRIYAELDINLCKIKLHQPLRIILEQPLLYVRDLVPRPCFQCLTMMKDIVESNCLKDVCRNALFPNHEMVISMSREFGVPITHGDFEDHHQRNAQEDQSTDTLVRERSDKWTPIDNTNKEFDTYMHQRSKFQDSQPDYVLSNIVAVQEAGRRKRPVSKRMVHADINGPSFNYSSQTLNSTELSKTALRKMLYEKDRDGRYAYNENYNSAIIPPVDEDEYYRDEENFIKHHWRTDTGFIFPGVKSSLLCNAHPLHPNEARIDELKLKWRENTLHDHVLKPTLRREIWSWDMRGKDMNLYSTPPEEFGKSPLSIHLPGQKAHREIQDSRRRAFEEWKSRIIVNNTRMNFHAVGSKTEHETPPNQVDKLQNILRDHPTKLSLTFNPPEVPPLSVVTFPQFDHELTTESQRRLPKEISRRRLSPVIALQPGPFEDFSLKMDKNTIPIKDPEHQRFSDLKGSDFSTFLKTKEYLWKRAIPPLSNKEKYDELFRTSFRPAAPRRKIEGLPTEYEEEKPVYEDKRSEYRTRYLPASDARRRLPILPRHQLGGLSHILQKDASIDLKTTREEAEKFSKSHEKLRGKIEEQKNAIMKDDVQIVKNSLTTPVAQIA